MNGVAVGDSDKTTVDSCKGAQAGATSLGIKASVLLGTTAALQRSLKTVYLEQSEHCHNYK